MKITLLRNLTKDIAEDVWRASRSQDTPTDGVKKVDAPVNDFPVVTLAVECTIAEREVFVTMRDHVIWARTSRVDDPLKFEVDSHYDIRSFDDNQFDMNEKRNMGLSQDHYRLHLPLVAMTSFTCQISMRSLIKLWHVFNDLCDDAIEPQASDMYGVAAAQMLRVIEHCGWKDSIGHIKRIDLFPEIENAGGGRIGDMLTIHLPVVPIALRAQVIRHRSLFVKDGMADILKAPGEFQIGDALSMQISADIDTWRGIISKRQCWLAQHDLWKPLVDQVAVTMGNMHMLPCSGKESKLSNCPYEKDAMLRYTSADPNPPCPMHALLNDIDFTDHKDDARDMIASDSRPAFWYQILSNVRVEK